MTKNCNIAKFPTMVVEPSQQTKFGTWSFEVRIWYFVSRPKSEIVISLVVPSHFLSHIWSDLLI